MLFEVAPLGDLELHVLDQVDDLRNTLRLYLQEPRRWFGSLRRAQFARAVQGSNSIEGFSAALDDAAAIDLGEEPLDADEETKLAIKGYCEAMTFVLQLASDAGFSHSALLLKGLHFMMTSYSLANRPGRWRAGPIYVHDERTGENVYEGPPLEEVAPLTDEFIAWLNEDTVDPPIVRAAMAHLNLVMIHPFRDGNGRMARCLQTLLLAREGIVAPEFSSIEEYLGRRTQEYYDVLAATGGGRWHPEGDTRAWLRFSMTAHLRQGRAVLRRIKEGARLWDELERATTARGLPERVIAILWDAAMGYRVRRSTYAAAFKEAGEDITDQMATRDLRQLVDHGLLLPEGEKRGRYYVASKELRRFQHTIVAERDPRDDSDPFAVSP